MDGQELELKLPRALQDGWFICLTLRRAGGKGLCGNVCVALTTCLSRSIIHMMSHLAPLSFRRMPMTGGWVGASMGWLNCSLKLYALCTPLSIGFIRHLLIAEKTYLSIFSQIMSKIIASFLQCHKALMFIWTDEQCCWWLKNSYQSYGIQNDWNAFTKLT